MFEYTIGHIAAALVIIVLMIVGFRKAKKERVKAFEERMKELTMPSGELVPSDDELFGMTEDDLFLWSKEDLKWVINYAGHKAFDGSQEQEFWRAFYERASHTKNKHGWDESPYYE